LILYTGIVAGTAPILKVEDLEEIRSFTLDLSGFESGLKIGASVSLDGVCMTVARKEDCKITFDAIPETIERTNLGDRREGDLLNVERSLKLGDELGGHILSGHVMCTAEILERKEIGGGIDLIISISDQTRPYIFEKGFIAIDGMSLTVGKCDHFGFNLHIIPETLRVTTIGDKAVGERVNVEIDSRTQAVIETMLRKEGVT